MAMHVRAAWHSCNRHSPLPLAIPGHLYDDARFLWSVGLLTISLGHAFAVFLQSAVHEPEGGSCREINQLLKENKAMPRGEPLKFRARVCIQPFGAG